MVTTRGANNNNTHQQQQHQQQGPGGAGDGTVAVAAAVVAPWWEGLLSDDSDDEDYVQGRGMKKTKKKRNKKKRRRRLTMPPTTNNNKRSRVGVVQQPPKQQLPPIEMLPPEIWKKITLMLDNNREVFNLATRCNNKLLHRLIVNDDEIVIRSAVFSGGYPLNAMSKIIKMVEKRSICVPSTYRLLRLANATMCERLHDCYGYNLQTHKSSSNNIAEPIGYYYDKRMPFGLAICPNCVDVVSATIAPSSTQSSGGHRRNNNNNNNNSQLHNVLFATNHDRVATTEDNSNNNNDTRLMIGPTAELATGEITGAYFFGKDIKQIANTYDTPEERDTALQELFKNADEKRHNADNNNNNEQQQQQQQQAEAEEVRVKKLVDICNTTMAEYPAFVKARQKVIDDKEQAKEQEEMTKRKNDMRDVYDKMSTALDGYEHKDIVLECTWYDDSRHDCFRFKYKPSQAILGRLILKNPCKSTARKCSNAAKKVREAFDLLHDNGFLSHNYLGNLGDASHHVAGRALQRYCRKKYPTFESLLGTPEYDYYNYSCDASFLAPLRQGKPDTALCVLLEKLLYSDFQNAFVDNALNMCNSQRKTTRDRFKKAATRVWRQDRNKPPRQLPGDNTDGDEYRKFKARFDRCRADYQILILNFREYKRQPDTVAFLAETGPPPDRPGQTFTRSNAVNKTLEVGRGDDLLRNRDFTALLDLHRRIFQNPHNYYLG